MPESLALAGRLAAAAAMSSSVLEAASVGSRYSTAETSTSRNELAIFPLDDRLLHCRSRPHLLWEAYFVVIRRRSVGEPASPEAMTPTEVAQLETRCQTESYGNLE